MLKMDCIELDKQYAQTAELSDAPQETDTHEPCYFPPFIALGA